MKYSFTLTGKTPLLMHRDDVVSAEELDVIRKDHKNKGKSKPGDDRFPAWGWMTCLYYEDANGNIVMPAENMMRCLRGAATKIMRGGKNSKETLKTLSQTGLLIEQPLCDFYIAEKMVAMKDIFALKEEQNFLAHTKAVQKMGFSLFVKRAVVGMSKHVRVRPRFDKWRVQGTVQVLNDEFKPEIMKDLFGLMGQQGLCDWRPSSKVSPGPFGQFEANLVKV